MTDERIFELIEKQDKYYILGFIKGIKAHLEESQQENQQLKERIKKAVEYIETWNCPECDIGTMREICFNSSKEDLLEILKGDSNE